MKRSDIRGCCIVEMHTEETPTKIPLSPGGSLQYPFKASDLMGGLGNCFPNERNQENLRKEDLIERKQCSPISSVVESAESEKRECKTKPVMEVSVDELVSSTKNYDKELNGSYYSPD